jgi:hypothetical protein
MEKGESKNSQDAIDQMLGTNFETFARTVTSFVIPLLFRIVQSMFCSYVAFLGAFHLGCIG